jgi:tetratricopeptide (TPR) repeat protein
MKYLELYPDGYNSHDSMGEFFMYEKDYDEAKKYYEMVLDIFPFSNSALTSLNEIEKLMKN